MIKIKNGILYQWDINRSFEICDPDGKIFEVHCCLESEETALSMPFTVNGDRIEAFIPNIFLQSAEKIHIFVVYKENSETRTSLHKVFPVVPRAKPSDYVYEETEVLKYKNLEKELMDELAVKADLDENGKLKEEQLPENVLNEEALNDAVTQALTQAKESGDFKGEKGADGYTPVKGVDYFDGAKGEKGDKGDQGIQGEKGADGYTPVKGVDYFDGAKGEKGDKGDQGIRGENGADGYTPVKGLDYFTASDKAEIAQMVIESFGGNPVVGYVDESNNIIVQGNLPDGSYSVKYEMEDGSTVNIGSLILDSNVYYSVTNKLTFCTNSNSMKEIVEGNSYSATVSANSGCELKSLTVTMGGINITASAVSGGNVNIANVTGNIVITAVAEEKAVAPAYTNLFVPANAVINKRVNSSNELADADGKIVTNFIDMTGKVPFTANTKIYIKGAVFTPDGNTKLSTFKTTGTAYTNPYTATNGSYITTKDEGNGVISVSNLASSFTAEIVRMCMTLQVSTSKITSADIQNIIITIDEPIS